MVCGCVLCPGQLGDFLGAGVTVQGLHVTVCKFTPGFITMREGPTCSLRFHHAFPSSEVRKAKQLSEISRR